MGKTIAEKIIEQHLLSGEMKPGEEIGLRIDQTLTQDATGTMAYLEFESMGAQNGLWLISITIHYSPVSRMRTITGTSRALRRSTVSGSPVRETASAISCSMNASENRERH